MIKVNFHIPYQQYGFVELQGNTKDLPDMEKLQERYAERAVKFSSGVWKKLTTFTNEEVEYNEETHQYRDLKGNILIGGSTYAKQFEAPFDKLKISQAYAVKNNMAQQDVLDIWETNGKLSRLLGTTLHLAMENYFKHNGQPAYNIPKSPYLAQAIQSCIIKDETVHSEIMVSDIRNGRVGQVDLLVETKEKKGYIVDWKTDFSVKKNLVKHFNQLSYYANILIEHGWNIDRVEVHNFVENQWDVHTSEVLPIK